jgi:nucleoside phosphorylase
MEISKVNLIVFDEQENFEKTKDFLGYVGSTIKNLFCIQNETQLKNIIENNLVEEDYIFLVVHVFGKTPNLIGIKKFLATDIPDKYPLLEYVYISDGAKQDDIQLLMIKNGIAPIKEVYNYSDVRDGLKSDKFKVITKKEVLGKFSSKRNVMKDSSDLIPMQFDYAIITALEEDEMQKILPMIEKKGEIKNSKLLIEYGHLIGNEGKTVIYASQPATGMIDAAILSTELLKYNPTYLIMSGVLGGKPHKTNIGDVVVATRTFTVDKGKIDDLGFHIEIETTSNESATITKLRRSYEGIKNHLRKEDKTRKSQIDIHFGPIGCVRQVIDIEGFFQEKINSVDRKAIALEMESYAVSRSCELISNGNTIPLIIKSVMDNTVDKADDGKPYAGWSSAESIKYILENDII